MKKTIIITAALLLGGICGQSQTTTKQKPVVKPKVAVAPPAVSDSFAKIALHALIAMRNSDGSAVAAGHIETLLEDMEIEQTTLTEKRLTQYFGGRNKLHLVNLRNFAILPEGLAKLPDEQFDLKRDTACFDAYVILLKANDSKTDFDNAPPECNLELTPRDNLLTCIEAANGDSVAIDKCRKEFLSKAKDH
jgi:hypothetical protein